MHEVRIFPRATERWQECIAGTRWWQALCEYFNNAHFFLTSSSRATLTLVYTWCAQYKRRSILISWKYDEALWEKINCIATSYIFREVTSWEIYEMFIVSTVERFACQSDLQHGTKGSILITWKKMKFFPVKINRIVISLYIFFRELFVENLWNSLKNFSPGFNPKILLKNYFIYSNKRNRGSCD